MLTRQHLRLISIGVTLAALGVWVGRATKPEVLLQAQPTLVQPVAPAKASDSPRKPCTLKQEAVSSIELGKDEFGNSTTRRIIRQFTLTYENFVTRADGTVDNETLLLQEEFDDTRAYDLQSLKSAVRVTAWHFAGCELTKKAWTIEHEGYTGREWDGFYKIIKAGCCATPSVDFLFDLSSGQKLYSVTYDALRTVSVPNSNGLVRYVAIHSSQGPNSPAGNRDTINQQGIEAVLQYGTAHRLQQMIAVRSEGGNLRGLNPRLKFRYQGQVVDGKDLRLNAAAGQERLTALSDFDIVLDLGTSWGEIIIPVKNDRVLWNRAENPTRFTLVPIVSQ